MENNKQTAIAFDLDGTLCDTLPDLAAAANAMRAHFSLAEIPIEHVRAYIGDGVDELIHRTLTDNKSGQADAAQWQEGLDFFKQYYAEHIAVHTTLYPDCELTLQKLTERNIKLAIVTNKEEKLARKLLDHFDLTKYFSEIIGGDTLSERKPNPAVLQELAQRLKLGSVDEILMVGDSINDILVSRNAGCRNVLIYHGYGDVEALQENPDTCADLVLTSLKSLGALV